jgi:hypothetical protein
MTRTIFLFIVLLMLFAACQKYDYNFNPEYDKTYLAGTTALPLEIRPFLIGNYSSTDNSGGLGNKFVLLWNQNKLSIFSNVNGNYAVLDVGV